MAIYKIKILSEKLFSKRGKIRKDKRVAYNLAQQRKANQQKVTSAFSVPKQQPEVKPIVPVQQNGTVSTPPNGSTLQLSPSDFQQKGSVVSNPVSNQQTSLITTGGNNKQVTPKSQPDVPILSTSTKEQLVSGGSNINTGTGTNSTNTSTPKKESFLPNIKPENVVIGQQPTGQQGTTGSVNWGQLGKSAFGKAKPILKGAALTAGVLAAGTLAGTALMANKAGKAVSESADKIGERLDENRRWRREEKMAKRLIKAGYNPYQEGQRIGGYAFTGPRY